VAKADTATGEELERNIPFLKGYTVFNAEQIDGLPAHFETFRDAESYYATLA
jgi:antirestriction protein ArdC